VDIRERKFYQLTERVIKTKSHINKGDFFHGILSRNKQMHKLFEKITKAAKTNASIYISGETGVGKELVARAIHAESARVNEPFIAVNVANFSSELIESQLFGHKKGAFTGALENNTGLFKAAKKGTLFLDEVACLTLNTQAKLLRVLQERQYYPVGDVNLQKFSASVISASNMTLEEASKRHEFREDLRYRLEVISLQVPPLRDRRDDIILLYKYFLQQASGINSWELSATLESTLLNHEWPGNIRELENCARFTAAMATGKYLKLSDLPESIQTSLKPKKAQKKPVLNKQIIAKTLDINGGSRSETARHLGISRMTLWRKMQDYNLK